MRDTDRDPFFSVRNIPLWVGVFLAGVIAVLAILRGLT